MGIAGTFLGSIDVPHCAQNFHHSRRWYSHAAQVHAATAVKHRLGLQLDLLQDALLSCLLAAA